MEIAGSSRPCSGSEHLISHALDSLHPGTAQHGEQVAFGALLATHLQGGDWRGLRDFMRAAGLQDAAAGFGLPAAGGRGGRARGSVDAARSGTRC